MHLLKRGNNVDQAGSSHAKCGVYRLSHLVSFPFSSISLLFHLPLLLNDEWQWQVAEASEPVAPSEVDACKLAPAQRPAQEEAAICKIGRFRFSGSVAGGRLDMSFPTTTCMPSGFHHILPGPGLPDRSYACLHLLLPYARLVSTTAWR